MNPKIHSELLKDCPEIYSLPSENGDGPGLVGEEEPSVIVDSLLTLWRERRFILKAFGIGLVVAAIISFIIPARYEATTRIMPPERQGLGGLAAMLAAAGESNAGSLVGGIVSDAMGIKTSGALYTGILRSSTVQDALINHFNLRRVYGLKYQKDARERLAENTDVNEDRKSGIISISITDRSKQRATDMANAYIDELNRLTVQLNTSAAHRERVFIEDRLKTAKEDLDQAAADLSAFSSKNLTLDVQEQGKAMVAGTASLTGELIAAESELSGLEQIYAPNNFRVRSLQARISELKKKLAELKGTAPGDQHAADEYGPSIAELPSLGVKYYDLYRRAKIQETVFEILTKQYELAKIEEAKELPTIKVLDEAKLPETKSSPKRRLITIIGGLLAAFLSSASVLLSARMRSLSLSHPLNVLIIEIREGMRNDLALLLQHVPSPIARLFPRNKSNSESDRASSASA
ncbi:MAG TPA: Wzz/FepE/Etk N-terminal domain-containing protein [Terriglobales bacterium]|nr:Wzz/FepE/Etk N-terminal domain-containing protein [Terriglobales bacterium]